MALPSAWAKQLEEQGRYILAANLVDGRRVLDIGRGYPAGMVALAEAGAQTLTARSHEPEALITELDAAGLEGTVVDADAPLPLPYEDAAFDLVICHDLPALLTQDPAWESEIRRVLSADGYLVAAVANPQGSFISELAGDRFASDIAYEDFVNIWTQHFAAVSVFGQSPLTATLFFDFAESSEETGLTYDRSLLPDVEEQPGWYICVFGPEEYHRDDLSIVQLPFDSMLAAAMEARQNAVQENEEAEQEPNELDEDAHEEACEEAVDEPAAHAPPPANLVERAALEHAERVIHTLENDRRLAHAMARAAHDALHSRVPEDRPETLQAMRQLRLDLEASQKKLARVSSELDGREEAIVHLEVAYEQSEREAGQFKKDAADSREAITHLRADLAEAHRMLGEARTAHQEAEVLAQAAQAMSAQGDALQLRVRHLEAEAEELRRDQARLHEVSQELTRHRNDRASFEAQIRDLLEEVAGMRKNDESMQTALQTARDALQTASVQAAHDKAAMEHEHARLEAELARSHAAGVAEIHSASALQKPHDAIGRELDTAVEELEDLLKDVHPPISTGR